VAMAHGSVGRGCTIAETDRDANAVLLFVSGPRESGEEPVTRRRLPGDDWGVRAQGGRHHSLLGDNDYGESAPPSGTFLQVSSGESRQPTPE
jgi:hypothetical protein